MLNQALQTCLRTILDCRGINLSMVTRRGTNLSVIHVQAGMSTTDYFTTLHRNQRRLSGLFGLCDALSDSWFSCSTLHDLSVTNPKARIPNFATILMCEISHDHIQILMPRLTNHIKECIYLLFFHLLPTRRCICLCPVRCAVCRKHLPHTSHEYGLIPS